jgi:SAM-dependent methyltransferase
MQEANPLTANVAGEDWAGEMGERWLANLDRFESMIAAAGDALIARADFKRGERVIDIGCGGGASTRAIAALIAPNGVVQGLDIAPVLVAEATRRARAAGLANAAFSVGDAATTTPPGAPYDRLFSRFGSMFFTDPPSAFRNLGRMVRPGGRIDLGVWSPAKGNPFTSGLMGVLRKHIEVPTPAPGTPGPFSLDEPDRVRTLLEGAGFADVDFYFWQGQLLVGGAEADAATAARFVLEAMSFGRLLAEHPQPVRTAVEAGLRELFVPHQTASGVAMRGNAWFVSARRLG